MRSIFDDFERELVDVAHRRAGTARKAGTSRQKVGISSIVVCLVIAVTAAVSSATNDGKQHARLHVPRVSNATQSRVTRQFAVFGTPATASDQVPSGPFAGGDSRSIGPADVQTYAWALINGSELCLTADGQAACDSLTHLGRPDRLLILGGASDANVPAGGGPPVPGAPQFLVGLIPSGSSAVTITSSDGTTITPTVTRNGFEIQTDGKSPRSVTWTTANGTTETQGL